MTAKFNPRPVSASSRGSAASNQTQQYIVAANREASLRRSQQTASRLKEVGHVPSITGKTEKIANRNDDTDPLLLRAKDAAKKCGLSRSAWYKAVAAGKAPQPVRIGERVSRWRTKELEQWVEAGCPSFAVWKSIREGVQ